MTGPEFELRLAEALAARLCHELVNPVGAIANGIEILREDPGFAADATAMVGLSVREASKRLQFYRFAYGSLKEPGTEAARAATAAMFEDGRVGCDWPSPIDALPPGFTKLAMNLLILAADCIPRGGEVALRDRDLPADGSPAPFAVRATGTAARVPDEAPAALGPASALEEITPRNVHAAFTAALARRLGFELAFRTLSAEAIELILVPSRKA